MPATLNLAATASLLLLVRSVKQPREALSHTDIRFRALRFRAPNWARPIDGPTLKRGA